MIPRKYLPQRELDHEYTSWKYILIEGRTPRRRLKLAFHSDASCSLSLVSEPFELTNTARSVYNGSVFAKILQVFEKSANALRKSRSLSSLFKDKFYNASNSNDDNYYGNNYNNNNNNNNYAPYRKRFY